MKKQPKKIIYIRVSSAMEWPIIAFFMTLGVIGLTLSFKNEKTPQPSRIQETQERHSKHEHSNSHHSPVVPRVLSPIHGAHYISTSDDLETVTLKWEWLPKGLHAEVELHRVDDPDYKPVMDITPGGAITRLPDGTYSWRVRSLDHSGKHSEWSRFLSFSVQENPGKVHPIVLKKVTPAESHGHHSKHSSEPHFLKPTKEESSEHSHTQPVDPKPVSSSKKVISKASPPRVKSSAQRSPASHSEASRLADKYLDIVDSARERIADLTGDPNLIRTKTKLYLQVAVSSEALSRGPASSDAHPFKVLLEWKPVPGAISYEVTVFKGKTPLLTQSTCQPHYEWKIGDSDLKADYFYQVTAKFPEENNVVKTLSSPMSQIQIEVTPPRLARPAPDSDLNPKYPVEFIWKAGAGTQYCDFQLTRNSKFDSLLQEVRVEENSIVVPMLKQGIYYWRVRCTQGNLVSRWSPCQKFHMR